MKRIRTIQQTAKKWKALQLLGFAVVAASGASTAAWGDATWFPPGAALAGFAVGLTLLAAGALLAWWHHG